MLAIAESNRKHSRIKANLLADHSLTIGFADCRSENLEAVCRQSDSLQLMPFGWQQSSPTSVTSEAIASHRHSTPERIGRALYLPVLIPYADRSQRRYLRVLQQTPKSPAVLSERLEILVEKPFQG